MDSLNTDQTDNMLHSPDQYMQQEPSDPITTPQWYEVLGDRVIDETTINDTSVNSTTITPEDILRMINEAVEDEEHQDEITVFPLMCGSGKSTAIRLKMRQIIEENDGSGMIIVTDNLDRMRDYLNPPDEELRDFFLEHSEYITVITHNNFQEATRIQSRSPILIMSTQRYVNLSTEDLRQYLTWDNGSRNLIIVDEQPILYESISINKNDLNTIRGRIYNNIQETGDARINHTFLIRIWQKIEREFLIAIRSYRRNCRQTGWSYGFYSLDLAQHSEDRPHSEFSYNPYNRDLDLDMLDDAEHLIKRYRRQIDPDFSDDIVKKALSAIDILRNYAVVSIDKYPSYTARAPEVTFSKLHSNVDHYTELGAKVIVLDGTADISTAYKLIPNLDDRTHECSQFKRSLSNLNINIYNVATSKTTLSHGRNYGVFDYVHSTLNEEIPEAERRVVFTYKDCYGTLTSRYSYNARDVNWFGNIKGLNDYRNVKYIAQIGLNRWPKDLYFLYELESNPSLIDALKQIDPIDQHEFIKRIVLNSESFSCKAETNEVLADLEQNMFRGIIRNSNCRDLYTFYLFTSLYDRDLIQHIRDRYEQQLQARVILHQRNREENELIRQLLTKKPSGVFARPCQIIIWHDTQLQIGDTYTTSDISSRIGISRNSVNQYLKPINNYGILFKRSELDHIAAEAETSQEHRGADRRSRLYKKTQNWLNEEQLSYYYSQLNE